MRTIFWLFDLLTQGAVIRGVFQVCFVMGVLGVVVLFSSLFHKMVHRFPCMAKKAKALTT